MNYWLKSRYDKFGMYCDDYKSRDCLNISEFKVIRLPLVYRKFPKLIVDIISDSIKDKK